MGDDRYVTIDPGSIIDQIDVDRIGPKGESVFYGQGQARILRSETNNLHCVLIWTKLRIYDETNRFKNGGKQKCDISIFPRRHDDFYSKSLGIISLND